MEDGRAEDCTLNDESSEHASAAPITEQQLSEIAQLLSRVNVAPPAVISDYTQSAAEELIRDLKAVRDKYL